MTIFRKFDIINIDNIINTITDFRTMAGHILYALTLTVTIPSKSNLGYKATTNTEIKTPMPIGIKSFNLNFDNTKNADIKKTCPSPNNEAPIIKFQYKKS